MTARTLLPVVLCALALVLVSGCAKTPKTACENILSIADKEASEANMKECLATYFWPLRQAGSMAEVNEEPHMVCYNEAKTQADVDKCLAALLDDAAKVPNSDVAKARAAEEAAKNAGALEAVEQAAAAGKAVALEGCVTKCSAEVPEVTDPKYAECMTACKAAAGL